MKRLYGVYHTLSVKRCPPHVVRRTLSAARCPPHVVCHVLCCTVPVACRMPHIVCHTLSATRRLGHCATDQAAIRSAGKWPRPCTAPPQATRRHELAEARAAALHGPCSKSRHGRGRQRVLRQAALPCRSASDKGMESRKRRGDRWVPPVIRGTLPVGRCLLDVVCCLLHGEKAKRRTSWRARSALPRHTAAMWRNRQ